MRMPKEKTEKEKVQQILAIQQKKAQHQFVLLQRDTQKKKKRQKKKVEQILAIQKTTARQDCGWSLWGLVYR